MAMALLASPSMRDWSPDSSFGSDASSSQGSSDSPRLPGWMDMVSDTPASGGGAFTDVGDFTQTTPSRSTTAAATAQAQPAWLTDELDEEWVEQDSRDSSVGSDDTPRRDERTVPPTAMSTTNVTNETPTHGQRSPTATFNTAMTSLNKPRVPSSLRFVYTTNDDSVNIGDALLADSSVVDNASDGASVGTFVIKSNPSTTGGNEDQLQAAVRALKGPGAGFGGLVSDGGHTSQGQNDFAAKSDQTGPHTPSLLNLFDPPSPPPPVLPPSTIPAPSADAFTFTPPVSTPRTSWKSLRHFSPDDTADGDNSATPVARPSRAGDTDTPKATPSRPVAQQATAPKARGRYLHRATTTESVESAMLPALEEEEEESAALSDLQEPLTPPGDPDRPSTPAPSAATMVPSTPQGGMPALKLFEFKYDTFTRDHLAALVDEIDELSATGTMRSHPRPSPPQQTPAQVAWETSFVDVLDEAGQGSPEHGDESRDSAEAARSVKRIRLSPREDPTATSPPLGTQRSGRRLSASRSRTSERDRRAALRTAWGASASARRVRRSPLSASPRRIKLRLEHSIDAVDRSVNTQAPHGSRTRERLDEANALLDRIRNKKVEREKARLENERNADESAETGALDQEDNLYRSLEAMHESQLYERWSESASELLSATPKNPRSRLSASSKEGRTRPSPLPRLAATASAMIRSALEESAASSPANRKAHAKQVDEPVLSLDNAPVAPLPRRQARRSAPLDQNHGSVPYGLVTSEHMDKMLNVDANKVPHPAAFTSRMQNGHAPYRSLTTIGPQDVEELLAKTVSQSRMVFDKSTGRWIKSARNEKIDGSLVVDEDSQVLDRTSGTDDDPFCEVDSSDGAKGDLSRLVEAEADAGALSGLGISAGTPGKRPTEAQSIEDQRTAQSPLDACHFQAPPRENFSGSAEVHVVEDDDTATWGDGESQKRKSRDPVRSVLDVFPSVETVRAPEVASCTVPAPTEPPTTPRTKNPTSAAPRSALKNARPRAESGPPTSTPVARITAEVKAPRSVSFSDGKTTGKIEGLVADADCRASALRYEVAKELMDSIENAHKSDNYGTNSLSRLTNRANAESSNTQLSRPTEHQSQGIDLSAFEPRTFRRTTAADATFLTECSFGVSTEKLLKYITDVEPFEPHWEALRGLDLSSKGADSLIRLKDFLPNLDEVNLNNNDIAFLTGAPSSLRTLLVSSNRLTSVTSFGHLLNLERIDLSNNQLDTLQQLSCLRHLRELKADNNRIRDVSGLAEIDGLIRLSLKGNAIEDIDFEQTAWTRLELLNLSRNRITSVHGLQQLQSLTVLNLDHNNVTQIEPSTTMPRLRVLRACSNPIEALDVAFAPKLRTLYVDSARLGAIYGTDTLRKLENLSVRDQNSGTMTLAMRDVRDVRRLYLSGNPLPTAFPTEQFFNLVYLELAMCQITRLPEDLAAVVPNVRVLNLNHNFIEDLSPLAGLTRITKLSVVGAQLSRVGPVSRVLSTMSELEHVDLRMNPLTLAFYPPFITPPSVLLPSHAEHQIVHPDDEVVPLALGPRDWPVVDKKFRRALPDEYYFRRASYRAILLQSVPSLVQLDGLAVERERPRLEQVLDRLAARRLTDL